jgi:hypothetical protein
MRKLHCTIHVITISCSPKAASGTIKDGFRRRPRGGTVVVLVMGSRGGGNLYRRFVGPLAAIHPGDAGHFIQEEAPEIVVPALQTFPGMVG